MFYAFFFCNHSVGWELLDFEMKIASVTFFIFLVS